MVFITTIVELTDDFPAPVLPQTPIFSRPFYGEIKTDIWSLEQHTDNYHRDVLQHQVEFRPVSGGISPSDTQSAVFHTPQLNTST